MPPSACRQTLGPQRVGEKKDAAFGEHGVPVRDRLGGLATSPHWCRRVDHGSKCRRGKIGKSMRRFYHEALQPDSESTMRTSSTEFRAPSFSMM